MYFEFIKVVSSIVKIKYFFKYSCILYNLAHIDAINLTLYSTTSYLDRIFPGIFIIVFGK